MEYLIRNATLSDIEGIMTIEQLSFEPAIMESRAVFEERLSIAPDCNMVLCSKVDGAVEAYLSAEIWSKNCVSPEAFALNHSPEKKHNPNGSLLYISSFALAPHLRGKKISFEGKTGGLAKRFFSKALETLITTHPNLKEIVLLVHQDWKKAQHIYTSLGFQQVKVLTSFEDFNGKSALIYEKKL